MSVRDGLTPWSYRFDKAETLGEDGWVYVWEERTQPWFVTLGDSFQPDKQSRAGVYRRVNLDLKRIESIRWRMEEHLLKARRKVLAAALEIKRVGECYCIEDGCRVRLRYHQTYSDADSYEVRSAPDPRPETIVEQIALLLDTQPYRVGTTYRRLLKWIGKWWDKLARIERLLEMVAIDLIRRKLGDRVLHERGTPRVTLKINGRMYPFEGPNQRGTRRDHWPSSRDVLIDVDTMEPLKNRFYQAGRVFDAPFKKPKRRKKVKA